MSGSFVKICHNKETNIFYLFVQHSNSQEYMTGLARVLCHLLRLCPEVTPQRERIFTNERKWNECETATATNVHSPSFPANAYFEVRKRRKSISTSWRLLFMKYKGEHIGNCKSLKVWQTSAESENIITAFIIITIYFFSYCCSSEITCIVIIFQTHELPLSMVIWVPSWCCLWCLGHLREKHKKPHLFPPSGGGSRHHICCAL